MNQQPAIKCLYGLIAHFVLKAYHKAMTLIINESKEEWKDNNVYQGS